MRFYRIFLAIGGQASPIQNNKVWLRNLYDPLVALGHDVFLLDIDEFIKGHGLKSMSIEAKELLSSKLPDIFRAENEKKQFDIFFSYLHNGQIYPEILKEIKKLTYTVNYSTNFHQFEMYREIAGIVDCNIYISKIAKSSFDELGTKSYWMPLAANPTFYNPSENKNVDCIFIGSAYGPRPYLFWRLLQNGIDLKLYGLGWEADNTDKTIPDFNLKNRLKSSVNNLLGFALNRRLTGIYQTIEDELKDCYSNMNKLIVELLRKDFPENLHSTLSDSEYIKKMADAAIIINIQESRFNHDFLNHRVLFGSNLRDFEATMSRTFLCTQYSDEIIELFKPGTEVVCYHNEHDLADKLKYYLNHKTERDQIALAGYKRSIKEHTWENRFKHFFLKFDLYYK